MTTDFDTTMQLAGEAAMECLGTEAVIYTPRAGAARPIQVIVQRLGLDPIQHVPIARIKARQQATLGLDAASLDTGGDKITWSPKRGGPARSSRIQQVLAADGGFVTVEVA